MTVNSLKKELRIIRNIYLADTNFISTVVKHYLYALWFNKKIIPHHKLTIRGIANITTEGVIDIGLSYVGFLHKSDRTILNISGKLTLKSNYSIGRGCRFDIGPKGTVTIGTGGFMNCNNLIVILHKLVIGNDTIISWNCQILDEDFHEISYEGKKTRPSDINIGNKVWIGCNTKIYKGVTIADGCVIASDSVVKSSFLIPNCLISGNPARVIKENVSWR